MPITIREVDETSPSFMDVLRLAKDDRRYLGFLPDAGFADRARKGTLLAAVEGDATIGYVLYDLPGDRVKIVHLCVARGRRQGGVARALINAVSVRHRDRRGLEVRCRRDFPADALWPRLGFRPVVECAGRSLAGHPLTVWQLPHAHEDLFTLVDERREIAVIDNNVFKDLISSRSQGRATRRLLDDWVAELVELCVTDELLHEINNCEDQAMRADMQRHASGYRLIAAPPTEWEELVDVVGRLAPAAGEADHRHIARAVAADAAYFATRDDEILEAADRLSEALRIAIVRPEMLILALDRLRSSGPYEPEALQATSVIGIRAADIDQNAFVSAFLNYGAGERAVDLRDVLRPALAAPDTNDVRVFAHADGTLRGALILATSADQVTVKLVRASASDRVGRAIARQLAFLPRQLAATRGGSQVVITDTNPSAVVVRSLSEEGYVQAADGRWACGVQHGVVVADASMPTSDAARRAAAAERERHLWPLKVTGAGLPCFMLSINATWAAELFDTTLAAATLFGRPLELGLSREHVYYRGPGWPGGIAHPARLLWYVTGGAPGHPIGHLRAVSQLAEVVVGRPRTLHQRFARLGVWNEQKVCSAADAKNTVMALRFVDTEVFDQPLDLPTLRQLHDGAGLTFAAPQSPRRVPEHMFCLLYQRASAYAS
jgi:predicted nucleic acid-binding protein/GNAT superfamily N-acetyltransferase